MWKTKFLVEGYPQNCEKVGQRDGFIYLLRCLVFVEIEPQRKREIIPH